MVVLVLLLFFQPVKSIAGNPCSAHTTVSGVDVFDVSLL